jgi:hypothetical protein
MAELEKVTLFTQKFANPDPLGLGAFALPPSSSMCTTRVCAILARLALGPILWRADAAGGRLPGVSHRQNDIVHRAFRVDTKGCILGLF